MNIDDLLSEVAKREKCLLEDIQWYSWPQIFSTTAGPSGGAGGNICTSFQVVAFNPPNGRKCKYCAGVWRHWSGEFMQKW